MSRVLKAAAVLASGAATSLALTGGPAAASTTATTISVPGASGSISGIKWVNQNEATFRLTVKDTRADGIHAEGRVEIVQMNNDVVTLPVHKAVGNGHVYYNPKAYVTDNHPIMGIRIVVCATGISDSTGHKISLCRTSPLATRPI